MEPGFHRISKEIYLADPCDRPSLSASIAHILVSRSPAHAWNAHPKGGARRKDPSLAMNNGTLLDSLLLGGDTDIVESPYDEYRTNEAKAWRAAVAEAGKLPVKSKELNQARRAAEAIRQNLEGQGIVLDGEHQLTAVWEDAGVVCRARFDHWSESQATIFDLKTTENAHPAAVARHMVSYGYAIQHAAYVRAVETLKPELAGRVRMVFLFGETEPPYSVLVAHPAGTMRALGEHQWRKAVASWGVCLASGRFPDYGTGETEIDAPPWALTELEEGLKGFANAPVPF
jgi:hypothetical protein